jgi:ABC-type multidrug transport system fused ATPase/permease subunit
MRFGLPTVKPLSLISYIQRHRGLFWIEAAGGIIYNTVIVTGPIVLGMAIDAAGAVYDSPTPDRVNRLLMYCLLLVGLTAFFQYARYVKRKYIRDMCFRIRADMRAGLLGRTLGRPLAALEREPVGDLISRTIGDVDQVVSTVETTINEAWDTWLLMLSYLVVLLLKDARVTLICSIPVPFALYVAEAARHPLYRYSVRTRQAAGRVTSHLHATLNNVALLRLFGREGSEHQRLEGYAREQMQWSIKTALLQTGMMPVYAALASLGVVGVIGLGGQQVVAGAWTIGGFTAYLTMFLAMSRRTWVAARVFNRWHAARASWDRIREKLSADVPDVAGGTDTGTGASIGTGQPGRRVALPQLAPGSYLEVDNLSLSFTSGGVGVGGDVLSEVSFRVPVGSIVGVTGPVGAGKSALASVLTGLYPYGGSVRIGGIELRDLAPEARAELVAYSGQDGFLFSGTIADNVTFGRDGEVDAERLERCVYVAGLSDDLTLFRDGLSTRIGERGVRVSGGQRQRIALARALYASRPLLILDDPFSAVDLSTERRIIERLREELSGMSRRGSTAFIFSHRLNTFVFADYVLVLDRGRLVEKGTHEQLCAVAGGIYQRIYAAQTWMERDQRHG